MDLSFDFINQNLIHPFKGVDDSTLKKHLLEISHHFTLDRTKIQNYVLDKEKVSAYSAFYFPTNVPKIFQVLKWSQVKLDENKQWKVFDVGCGPGTLSLGFVDYFLSQNLEISLIDSSDLMLNQAKIFFKAYFPQIKVLANNFEPHENSVMLFGHSMNEMGVEKALQLVHKIKPKIIIFIEPGTKEVFSQILELRQKLVQSNYKINYPCPHEGQCPLMGEDDWCHQVLNVRHDPSIETLSQLLHKDRRNLPISAFVFSDDNYNQSGNRVIRKYPENKFAYNFDICHFDTRLKKLNIEFLKRHLSKSDMKDLEMTLQGNSLEFTIEKIINDEQWRVKLKKES
jgi:ribosomal protein RSM22 (predicted rRNA methylase)